MDSFDYTDSGKNWTKLCKIVSPIVPTHCRDTPKAQSTSPENLRSSTSRASPSQLNTFQ